MIFSLIRWVFVIIFFSVCYIIIRKSNTVNKRKQVILSLFMAIFFAVLSCVGPIENAFITFPTVESAYNYYYSKDGYIKHIVEGEKTDFIIAQKDNSNVLTIIPKTNNGWKIATGLDIKRVTYIFSHNVSIGIYRYKNSDDYYVLVHCINGNELELTDNRNSHFDYFEGEHGCNQTYCSYIHCFDEEYVITVNGEPLYFNNIQN